MHWPPALSIRGPSTSSPTATCWWLRATVRQRRSAAPRTSSPAGSSGSPAPRPRAETALRCCATPTVTAFLKYERSCWITSIRPSASRWLAMIFTWRTRTPSSAIPIRTGKPKSRTPAPSSRIFPADRSIITGPRAWWRAPMAPSSMSGSSNSNITENGIGAEYERAAVWEVDRASGAHRIFASGLRNPTGLAFEPETSKLWAVVNERDEIGPDLVPDYLTSVKDGGFYGWPYSYYGQHIDPRVEPQRPDLVAKAIVPDYALSSHVAPLVVAMYNGTEHPPNYRGGAFLSEHGSWDRTPLNGYKVVFVPFSGGKPSDLAQDVVTGFLDANAHARGRPFGLATDRTGGLLIPDDVGATVWRRS